MPAESATGSSVFVGLGNNGGNRNGGFRTNAGAYNPLPYPAHLKFWLYRNDGNGQSISPSGVLGTYSATWGPNEAKQVNDIFTAVGAGSAVTTNALLFVTSDLAVIPYVTIVDNVTGDSIVPGPTTY